ncbi:RE1-silencing transcription factor isoform X2 [Pyxicephalus adspersus]|uniref:RE1-silencing transcription factor isoform X2 n=1 Tax=Pyxicephalus adspersus TaxID=30357 RepID=UPI003B5979A0
MATQLVSQASSSSLFCNSSNFGISDMYGLHDLSKAEIAAPRLIMLANVALTGEVNNSCSDYALEEDKEMAELTTVYENSFSDSEGEGMEMEESAMENEVPLFQIMEIEQPAVQEKIVCDNQTLIPDNPVVTEPEKDVESPPMAEEKNKSAKSKPFQCRPCQYKAESEEEFVHHIKDHSAKRFIDHDTHKNSKESCLSEEVDTSKGPIRCDRCGYNTNRIDHYLAHLKHHNKAAENERVYKCTICTYTTVSEYHWKKHLRNHFPRIVYTCSQCSYFSDRKNNYIQHIRTHTGEKPFKCEQCNYVASNQHEVTRHARQLHNGPKPLTCPHCNYKTADRSNFKKHVELHVNPRQFLCPVCDYAASKKCNLQYHIKSRHSGCTDITMDVSKVKLRTKKEVPVPDLSKQEEKENSEVIVESVENETDGKLKLNKEKCETLKSASVGQVTKRNCKNSKQKTVEDASRDKSASKAKRSKRKFGSVTEKALKTNDAQNTSMKKNKLSQNRQPECEVPKKGNRGVKSQKRKLFMSNQQKPLKKKKTLSEKTVLTKNNSKEMPVDCIVETNMQVQFSGSETGVSLGTSSAAEIVPDQSGAKDPIENSHHEENSSTEEETIVHDASSSCSSTDDKIENCIEVLLERDNHFSEGEIAQTDNIQASQNTVNKDKDSSVEVETLDHNSQAHESAAVTKEPRGLPAGEPRGLPAGEPRGLPAGEPRGLPAGEPRGLPAEHTANNSLMKHSLQDESDELNLLHPPSNGTIDQDTKCSEHYPCDFISSVSLDVEEDEGIHSHEGSDISDNVSERSDDSGLNGLQYAQEALGPKSSPELPSVDKTAAESFVCIFCDRTFKKTEEYTKHLKRHLVNVYYLEKAAQNRL